MTAIRQLFGTDGIRGVANVEPVTGETMLRLGRAVAQRCRTDGTQRRKIVVGRDTRLSGDMLESALVAGICSAGVDVLLAGVLPTPAIAFLTRNLSADAGAVISASHNPFQDNGIKLFAPTGFKLPDEIEAAIEHSVLHGDADHIRPMAGELGRVVRVEDAAQRYAAFVRSTFPPGPSLAGLKLVIDCAHGAASQVGPQIFRELGADIMAIGAEPDGRNINDGYGALYPERLQERVRSEGAHVGMALDGDADRVLLVDEAGQLVDGDEMLALIAAEMLARGTLKHATVVATVMSNLGLEVALRERGARLVRVQVGDRYVVDEMRRHDCNLGGEQSGHVVLLDHSTTGDGLLAGLAVLRVMVERQRPLSELRRVMSKFPQALVNVRVGARADLDAIAPLRQTIGRITAALNGRGRVLVRYSGTEPLVRVMVEGEDAHSVRAYAEEIGAVIQAHLGGDRGLQ